MKNLIKLTSIIVLIVTSLYATDFKLGKKALGNQDYSKAVQYLEKSLKNKDKNIVGEAKLLLAYIYINGETVDTNDNTKVKRNYKKALHYLKDIPRNKNSHKVDGLIGSMYLTGGFGINKNIKKAFEYTRNSSDLGNKSSQCNLGFMYEKGIYVKKDLKKSFDLYEKSANNGYELCKHNMGVMYFDGMFVQQNYKKAYEWFAQAYNLITKRGYYKSKKYIYDMKCKGLGTKKDTSYCPVHISLDKNSDDKISLSTDKNNVPRINADIHISMYYFYRKPKSYNLDKIIYHLEEVYKLKNHPEYYKMQANLEIMLGGYHLEKKNYKVAINYLKKASKKGMSDATLQLLLIYKEKPELINKKEKEMLVERCSKDEECMKLMYKLGTMK